MLARVVVESEETGWDGVDMTASFTQLPSQGDTVRTNDNDGQVVHSIVKLIEWHVTEESLSPGERSIGIQGVAQMPTIYCTV